jgi:hypothetical protein
MLHELILGVEFFARLEAIDAQMAAQLAAQGCPFCGGPLHQGNYLRKPRGALLAPGGEQYALRYSLCCGWRDCRRRVLPPSLRFLGRRVYLEVVVLFATVLAQLLRAFRRASARAGVSPRTLRRWTAWWGERFPALPTWIELKAKFVPPPPDEALLPASLLDRLEHELTVELRSQPVTVAMLAQSAARLLAPATTTLAGNASRSLRGLVDGCCLV